MGLQKYFWESCSACMHGNEPCSLCWDPRPFLTEPSDSDRRGGNQACLENQFQAANIQSGASEWYRSFSLLRRFVSARLRTFALIFSAHPKAHDTLGDFIRRSRRSAKIAIAAPGTLGDYRRSPSVSPALLRTEFTLHVMHRARALNSKVFLWRNYIPKLKIAFLLRF